MKKIGIIFICLIFVLTSCAPGEKKKEEIVHDEKEKKELSIVPSYKLSKENYRMILPYKPGAARGVIVNQMANRVDVDEVEEGLRRHSKDYFDPEKYIFREGQFLTEDTVYKWLGRNLTKNQLEEKVKERIDYLKKNKMTVNEEEISKEYSQGLNPPVENNNNANEQKKHPKYLSHIVEQNYLITKDKKAQVAGISIGLAMKSNYHFYTEDAEKKRTFHDAEITKKQALEEGYKLAEKILKRMRKMDGLQNVPIMFAIYQEEGRESPVPGNFMAKTLVDQGKNGIGKWETIKEEHILFPSQKASEKYFEDAEVIKQLTNNVAEYFPNYVGMIGKGFYIKEELRQLVLEIPLEFHGKGEVLGFTQFIYGQIKELLSTSYDLEVKIRSSDKMESVLYREAGKEEPRVHVFQ